MIKVGYVVSYDVELLFHSIPLIYDHVDRIVLAVDGNRRTWSGHRFDLPAHVAERIRQVDPRRIIEWYEDDFALPALSPMENETRERNLLAKRLGAGWLMQLDVDEYIYDFGRVAAFLRAHDWLRVVPSLTPVVLMARWVTLFREVPQGFLYIENDETFPFATNVPEYTEARRNTRIASYDSNVAVIHQSWARGEAEIAQKVANWGHSGDVHRRFVEFWKTVTADNYERFKNFHPLQPDVWKELKFMACGGVEEFIETYSTTHPQQLRPVAMRDVAADVPRTIWRAFKGRASSSAHRRR